MRTLFVLFSVSSIKTGVCFKSRASTLFNFYILFARLENTNRRVSSMGSRRLKILQKNENKEIKSKQFYSILFARYEVRQLKYVITDADVDTEFS